MIKINTSEIAEAALMLLKELKTICRDNDIEFFLAPKLAFRGVLYGGISKNFAMPQVYMTVKNCIRFRDVVSASLKVDKSARFLESLENSDNYPGFFFTYVNENTTFIRLMKGHDFQHHGISVKIIPLRDDVQDENAIMLEREWDSMLFESSDTLYDADNKKAIIRGTIFKRKITAGKLFDNFCKVYSGAPGSEKVFIHNAGKEDIYYDRSLFNNKASLAIDGIEFPVPENLDDFLSPSYGKRWRSRSFEQSDRFSIVASTAFSYKYYIQKMREKGVHIEELFSRYKEKNDDRLTRMKFTKVIDEAWNIAMRSALRCKYYNQLEPQIEKIRALREKGDYETLEVIFRDYNDDAVEMLKKGISICPDKELMDIECEIMCRNRRRRLSKRLIKNTPEEHLLPISSGQPVQGN